jgi:hypothetical protein
MIRNWILFVAIFTATLAGLSAAETAAKPATKKTAPTTKAVPKKSAPKKSTAPQSKSPARRPATATKSTKTTKGKAGSRPAPVVKRYRQAQPTPDRYKEIQEALVAKGYLKGEPTGVWDAQSVEALKKFQSDKTPAPRHHGLKPQLKAIKAAQVLLSL